MPRRLQEWLRKQHSENYHNDSLTVTPYRNGWMVQIGAVSVIDTDLWMAQVLLIWKLTGVQANERPDETAV